MRIGFTGTRHGMSDYQKDLLEITLSYIEEPLEVFHHGDCIGADDEANRIARRLGLHTEAWPSTHSLRAHSPSDVVHAVHPPLDRNRLIVQHCDFLIAAPSETYTTQTIPFSRSGTAYTIRYAVAHGVLVSILPRESTFGPH